MIKFFRGLRANYTYTTENPGNLLDALFFATDTGELLLNGKLYGSDGKRVKDVKFDSSTNTFTFTKEDDSEVTVNLGDKLLTDADRTLLNNVSDMFEGGQMNVTYNSELDGTVEIENDHGFYRITVNTKNNAIMIGKAGKSLQAFNRLVKAAVSAAFKKRIGLLIDVNGYKEERYEKICKMAVRIAKDVRRTKVDAVLDPMPADERKAIHNALAGMNDISTKSEGEGEGRRLHILYTPGKDEE